MPKRKDYKNKEILLPMKFNVSHLMYEPDVSSRIKGKIYLKKEFYKFLLILFLIFAGCALFMYLLNLV